MTAKRIKKFVGGQAVIEGVMMCGPKYIATAVRTPQGEIAVEKKEVHSLADRFPILKWPLLRGCLALYESLSRGMKSLMYSAKMAGEEEDGEELSNSSIGLLMLFSFVFSIVVFVVLPTYAVKYIPGVAGNHVAMNFVEGVLRLIIFLLYIWGTGRTADMKRMYQYHGAEHKTIHAYEKDLPLTVENVRAQTRLHPRCGTNFLLIVMIVSIIVFSFLGWPNLIERIVSRILLMPVVAGISYEIIRAAGRSETSFIRSVIAPGLCLQYLTTNEPDDDQIEVAIKALETIRPEEADAYES